ncbi:hypothetical protein OAI82_01565 [bacterium]|nr:hypothetical protein [bacterium]
MNNKYIWLIIPIVSFVFLQDLIIYNKIPLASDMVAHEPIKEWISTTSEFPQWFPNLFSGLPSYGGYIYTPGHPLESFLRIIYLNEGVRFWFYLSLGGIGLFFLLKFLKVSNNASLFGGLAYAITPYVFGLINAGHNNKIMAGAFTPFLILCALYMFSNRSIKSILLLSVVSALQLWTNHPQIYYYTWMVIGLWWLVDTIYSLIKNKINYKNTIQDILFLTISIIISLLMVSDPYYDIYKFQGESNRGSISVLDQTDDTKKGTTWDYATQWSFHPLETISFIYPYYYGLQNFSVKNKSEPRKFMKQASYWGYMPFTQSTHYLGLLIVILSFFSLWYYFKYKEQNRTEVILWTISFIILVIGFGSHLPLFYKPLFKFAPFFSKFRVPSMIYMMLSVLLPMIAAIGIDKIIKDKYIEKVFNDSLKIFGFFIFSSIVLLLFGDSFLSFASIGDNRFIQYAQIVKDIRLDLFNKGLFLALFICFGSLLSIYFYSKNKISKNAISFIFIGIFVIDLWIVNNEFLSLKNSKSMKNLFIQTQDIKYLNADSSAYRIFPADEIGATKYGYWNIQSIGGYHAIKLRHYQDLMDIGGFRRQAILNMLNVKYIITNKRIENKAFKKIEGNNNLYENLDVLPRSWVVGGIKSVESQKSSLSSIMDMSFRPNETATVLDYDGPDLIDHKGGNSKIIKTSPNEIIINCKTNGGGLLVLSEIYYSPGWKCKVDGIPSDIYQTNHILRSVFVPDGEHEVIFYYDDSNWMVAKIVSRTSFFSTILILCFLFYRDRKSIIRL